MNDLLCYRKRDSATKEWLIARLEQFATLATQLDFLDVADFPLLRHACHVCHAKKINELKKHSNIKSCFEWLTIAINEGNLEPSQPLMGKAIGWPQRLVNINSLWIDFNFWCFKQKISKNEIAEDWLFYDLLDCIFIRKGDYYEFTSLENCRVTFEILRQQYECD